MPQQKKQVSVKSQALRQNGTFNPKAREVRDRLFLEEEFFDSQDAEGSHDWSGQFVGTSFIFSDRAVLNTLEGDPRFFFDDSLTPQAQGTGTHIEQDHDAADPLIRAAPAQQIFSGRRNNGRCLQPCRSGRVRPGGDQREDLEFFPRTGFAGAFPAF